MPINKMFYPDVRLQQPPVTSEVSNSWVNSKVNTFVQSIQSTQRQAGSNIRMPDSLQTLLKHETRPIAQPDLSKLTPFIQSAHQHLSVNFQEIEYVAKLVMDANLLGSYSLREKYPEMNITSAVRGHSDVAEGYLRLGLFIIRDLSQRHQIVILTDDSRWQERVGISASQYEYDERLGVKVHAHYNGDAVNLFHTITRSHLLRKERPMIISGHSNAGAIAQLLQLHLVAAGYGHVTAITFGQPKVIIGDDLRGYDLLPLIRVINKKDPIPRLLPERVPYTLYRESSTHLGMEIVLEPLEQFRLLDPEQAKKRDISLSAQSLSTLNVAPHSMDQYVASVIQMPRLAYCTPVKIEAPFCKKTENHNSATEHENSDLSRSAHRQKGVIETKPSASIDQGKTKELGPGKPVESSTGLLSHRPLNRTSLFSTMKRPLGWSDQSVKKYSVMSDEQFFNAVIYDSDDDR